jgi:hypothetical protein
MESVGFLSGQVTNAATSVTNRFRTSCAWQYLFSAEFLGLSPCALCLTRESPCHRHRGRKELGCGSHVGRVHATRGFDDGAKICCISFAIFISFSPTRQ